MATVENETDHIQKILQKFYEDPTKEELINIYNTWSKTYDTDLKYVGYTSASSAAKLLSDQMKEHGFDLNARVLDMGSGTGLAGEELRKLGHTNIDGLDMSQESLKVAKEKGIYKNLIQGFMASENCKDLGAEPGQYDGLVCVGVLTHGHVRAAGFDDFIYAVKPGGLMCFSIRGEILNDPQYGYAEKLEELSQKKKWVLVKKFDLVFCTNLPEQAGRIYLYKKL